MKEEKIEKAIDLFMSFDQVIPKGTPTYIVVRACEVMIADCLDQNENTPQDEATAIQIIAKDIMEIRKNLKEDDK